MLKTEQILEDLYLSKSSIEVYQQCEAKFDYRYIKKIEVLEADSEKEAAVFGNLMHKVLEDYFTAGNNLPIIDIYKSSFNLYPIKSQDFFTLGFRMIEDYAKSTNNGNKILSVEYPFKLFLPNGVPVKGIIDRIDEISEEEIEIVDYKTGYSRPLTQDQLEKDLQLGIYNLVLRQVFPKYKRVKLTLDYLHHGKVSVYRTDAQLDALSNYLSAIYIKIQESIGSERDLKPTVNSYCSWCSYKANCSAFKEVITSPALKEDVDTYNGLISRETGIVVPFEKLDVFLDRIKSKMKILKKMETDVKDFILEHIEKSKDGKAQVGKTTYYSTAKKYTEYDVNTVLDIFGDKKVDMNQVLSPQKMAIDELLKGDKEALGKLNVTAKKKFSESFLK